MKRKQILVFLLEPIIFCLLAGCGDGGGQEPGNVTTLAREPSQTLPVGESLKTFLAYVQINWIDGPTVGPIEFMADKVTMVFGDDLDDGYELINEEEDWAPYITAENVAFLVQYSLDRIELDQRPVGLEEFRLYLSYERDGVPAPILANVTVSAGGEALRVEEVYVP
jgi:hypothetical protein